MLEMIYCPPHCHFPGLSSLQNCLFSLQKAHYTLHIIMLSSFLRDLSFQFLTLGCGFEHHLISSVPDYLGNYTALAKTASGGDDLNLTLTQPC